MKKTALVVGATGLSGGNLVDALSNEVDWTVYGVSKRGARKKGLHKSLALDLTSPGSQKELSGLNDVTHVFFCTWQKMATEAENCVVNRALVKNTLDGLANAPLQHVALVTGLKHYLGPFEAYAQGKPYTPFLETQPRLPGENFYYDQEDEVFEQAGRRGFTWTVHRPHTMIGYALGNAMNMAVTIAVYASICRETGMDFRYPGSAAQYQAAVDITDARLLAKQLTWAVKTPAAANTPFNIVNGDIFRWYWMWARIAEYFGLEPAKFDGKVTPLQGRMADSDAIWEGMANKYSLVKHKASELASWWHTDGDLGREIECFTDMRNSRERGFLDCQISETSFFDVFDRLIAEKIIPDFRSL